ncbi:MAG: right-handed parallel beta-helix repeat-containing protein [Salinivirgaceae bacterium]|nr:right-handed parallel beta-helix repeat-containing protein [Salinivirgaceae bacterium]
MTIDKSIIPNRHTLLSGEFVNPSIFTCMDNASIYMGAGSEIKIDNSSTFILDPNSKIYMGKYSDINVQNNSTLIINDGALIKQLVGAEIYVDETSKIIFNGGGFETTNYKNLKVDGTLIVGENKNLTLTEPGSIYLNCNINAEPGASITFEGVDQSTKLLEVGGKVNFDTDFANVTIKNGKIQMNNTSAELFMNSGIDNVTIDNVLVSSNNGINNSHEGIDIRSNGTVTVSNSSFENGNYGLYVSRAATSSRLVVDNCTFENNVYGLRVYNGSFEVSNSTFDGNISRGLNCWSIDGTCYFTNNIVWNQSGGADYGVYIHGESTARITFRNNIIRLNNSGTYLDGNFTASFSCNTLSDNYYYGLKGHNSKLYLAYAPGISSGNNDLSDNRDAIVGTGSLGEFYLNNGNNDLRSDNYCITGAFGAMPGGSIAANNNYWKTGGGAPSANEYSITGANGAVITLTDNSPNSYYQLCSALGELDELDKSGVEFAPYNETYDYREVVSDIGVLPLDVAVIRILNTEEENGEVFDLFTKYELLSDLLLSDLDDLNLGEKWYANHSYLLLKATLGEFKKQNHSDQISQRVIAKMIKTIKKLEKDLQKSEKKSKGDSEISPELFAFIINEADVVWYGGNYDEAIELLTDKQDVATAEQLCEIEKMICRINLDRDFIASNNTLDIDEALEACEICNSVESDKGDSGDKGSTSISNSMIDGIKLSIIPNPVTNGSEIRINGAESGSELYVYSSVGSIVFNETIASENYTKLVSNSELSEGIYMVSILNKGKAVANMKMVVTK